jgi:hypothetical protein
VPKELRSYPLTYLDLEQNLGIFGNLLGTVLGEGHPLTANYRLFWTALTKQYRPHVRQQIESHRTALKPVHILRSIQMMCYDWFDAKRSAVTPDTPNFTQILRQMGLGCYVIPLLRLPLYQMVTGTGRHLPPPGNQGPPNLTGTITSDDASTVGGLSTTTGLSGLTGTTSLTGLTQGTGRNALVVNEHADSHLASLIPFNRKLKDIIGSTQPPTTDGGDPICLSYDVKGGCYSTCRHKANHNHVLTASEKGRLENYIADRLAKVQSP